MDTWHRIALTAPLGDGPVAVPVPATGRTVLLVRDGHGVLHATAPACPHLGQPLSHGTVDGGWLECGHHAYRYALEDGRCADAGNPLAGRLVVHDVREVPGGVEVRLAAPSPPDPAP